jgi:predicted metal-dependent hydrolase
MSCASLSKNTVDTVGLLDRLRRDRQPEVRQFLLEYRDFKVPVTVQVEYRTNSRVAFGKKGVSIRLASMLNEAARNTQTEAFRQWILRQLDSHPDKYQRFRPKIYQHGQSIQVGNRSYVLTLHREADRSTVTGKLDTVRHLIHFYVPQRASDEKLSPIIESLLSRLIGAHYLPQVQRRVQELNERHFRQRVNGVRIKYNHSNWGSCSSKGNINLSSRLLFAPQEVLDYVIIHELAHLVEMNHSPRFWALVAAAMPDYKKHERWLSTQGPGMSY